jgi:uncharacterized membrane protein
LKKALALNLLLLVMVVIGAKFNVVLIPYLLIAWIIAFVILHGRINQKTYPIYIFGIALGLLWQTSLLGVHVVGADATLEYFLSNQVMKFGLSAADYHQYGTSLVVTMIAPFLARVVDMASVYKVIFPIFLAGVPVIMYFVYQRMLDSKKALLATLFFIFVPVMSLEIIGMAKAMVAELFFALTILALVSSVKYKIVILPILVMAALLCHYTVGLILIGVMFSCLMVSIVSKIINRDFGFKRKVSLIALIGAVLLPAILGYTYLGNSENGFQVIDTINKAVFNSVSIPPTISPENTEQEKITSHYIVNISKQSDLVQTAMGMDFGDASSTGKVFRIAQYITQLMIVLGLIQLWRNRKEYKFTMEFVACIIGGFAIILICILVPYFSNILNMSRFYHMSLFFLAPLFVLGCGLITKKSWLVSSILIAYFVFTSGLVYEITQNKEYEFIDMPYSYALSYERTGITGVFNQDDLNCARWLEDNADLYIVGDMNTRRLMEGTIFAFPRLYAEVNVPWSYELLPEGKYYIFLDTWNIEHDAFIFNQNNNFSAGLRISTEIPNYIYEYPVVYSSGKAVVMIGGKDE